MQPTRLLLALTAATAFAGETPLATFLAAAPDPQALSVPVPDGKVVVCKSGMHRGHNIIETPLPVLRGKQRWTVRYNVCTSRDAHPGMVDVWPREGLSGLGLRDSWYGGACIDVLIDGQPVGPYRATFRHAKGGRDTLVASWHTPQGHAELRLSTSPTQERLLVELRAKPAQPRARVELALRCFPASFAKPHSRFVVTPKREVNPPAKLMLGRDEFWVFCGDRVHDWPKDSRSHGPCAMMFDTAALTRASMDVGTYAIGAKLVLRRGVETCRVALWSFRRQPNAEALAAMRGIASSVQHEPVSVDLVRAAPRTLAVNGRPAAAIVTAPAPAPLVAHAAEELAEILFEMSGAALPIVTDREAPKGANRILLGATSLAPNLTTTALAHSEAFVLRTRGRDIIAFGSSPRGTLYAAYELLERLGWRCYVDDPLGMVIPKLERVVVPELEVTDAPDFPMRWIAWGEHSFRIRGNAGRRGMPSGFDVQPSVYHAMYRYLRAKVCFDAHPEWFALYRGKRKRDDHAKPCTTSPGAIRMTATNMRGWIDEHPGADLYSIAFKDHASYCECPQCRALNEPGATRDQTMSRKALLFYNAVAESVTRTHPDVKILAGSYHVYNRPPIDPTIKAHPSLSTVLCHYTNYCLMHPVTDPTCPRNVAYKQLLSDWQRLTPDVYFYEYYWTPGWCELPCPLVHTVRADIPYFHKIGCKGLYTQYGSVWNTFLTNYVAARLLWKVDTDVDALLEDFYSRFFGPAAKPMKAYFEALEQATASTDQHLCTCSMGGRDPRFLFTDALMAKLRALMAQAKPLAADDRMVVARLAKLETALHYTEQYRQYWAMVRSAQQMRPSPERSRAAAAALAHLDALKDDIRTHPQRYRGIVSMGSYHWRYAPRQAERMGGHKVLKHGPVLMTLPLAWRFALDKADTGEGRGWHKPGFDDSKWATIESGRYWEDQGYANYDGAAWYRTTLVLKTEHLEGPLALAFAGVDAQATVYLGGRKIGEHDGWDRPFMVALPAAKAGRLGPGKHSIAVRVFDSSAKGGMYGEVKLVRPDSKPLHPAARPVQSRAPVVKEKNMPMVKPIPVLVWTDAAGLHTEKRPLAYPEGIHNVVAGFLNETGRFKATPVAVDEDPLKPESLDQYRALVMWGHGRPIGTAAQRSVVEQVKAGKIGIVGLHSILIYHSNPLLVGSLFGQTARFGWEDHVPMRFTVAEPHPIFEGITSFDIVDEAYYEPFGLKDGFRTLLTMTVPDCAERDSHIFNPELNRYVVQKHRVEGLVSRAAWTYQVGKGKSFYFQPGHETDATYNNPVIQRILAAAVNWVAVD